MSSPAPTRVRAAHSADRSDLAVDIEPDGLVGLPLAAVHIERAVQAMASVTFGRWQVSIVSGDADQWWGFKQINPKRHDALADTIMAYRAGIAEFNQNAPADNNQAFDAYADVTFRPAMETMTGWTAPAPSLTTAVAALRIAFEELRDCGDTDFILPMLAASLGYFDQETTLVRPE